MLGRMPAKAPIPEPVPLDRRFFVIGCICLAVAISLAVAAFVIRDLSPDQRAVLRWTCSLAAGFAAGSFAGTFALRVLLG